MSTSTEQASVTDRYCFDRDGLKSLVATIRARVASGGSPAGGFQGASILSGAIVLDGKEFAKDLFAFQVFAGGTIPEISKLGITEEEIASATDNFDVVEIIDSAVDRNNLVDVMTVVNVCLEGIDVEIIDQKYIRVIQGSKDFINNLAYLCLARYCAVNKMQLDFGIAESSQFKSFVSGRLSELLYGSPVIGDLAAMIMYSEDHDHNCATPEKSGFMGSSDKIKLDKLRVPQYWVTSGSPQEVWPDSGFSHIDDMEPGDIMGFRDEDCPVLAAIHYSQGTKLWLRLTKSATDTKKIMFIDSINKSVTFYA